MRFSTIVVGIVALVEWSLCPAAVSVSAARKMQERPSTVQPDVTDTEARWACPDDVPVQAVRSLVRFESAGHEITAVAYAPTGPGNGAAIVMLHGAPGLRATLVAFDPRAMQLASRGYYVLQPQYYDATNGATARRGQALERWREVAIEGARRLAAERGVDPGKVGVWGYSLGGWLAAEAAMSGTSLRAAVGVAAGTEVAPPNFGRRTVPILLVHARRDPVISLPSNAAFARSLRARGAELDVRLLEERRHFYTQPIWCEVFAISREFFDRNLLTG